MGCTVLIDFNSCIQKPTIVNTYPLVSELLCICSCANVQTLRNSMKELLWHPHKSNQSCSETSIIWTELHLRLLYPWCKFSRNCTVGRRDSKKKSDLNCADSSCNFKSCCFDCAGLFLDTITAGPETTLDLWKSSRLRLIPVNKSVIVNRQKLRGAQVALLSLCESNGSGGTLVKNKRLSEEETSWHVGSSWTRPLRHTPAILVFCPSESDNTRLWSRPSSRNRLSVPKPGSLPLQLRTTF